MSLNSSSSFNSSITQFTDKCFSYSTIVILITTYCVTFTLLLVPLSILVVFVGYQRWKKRRSATSHSDIFTYNMAAMDMVRILGTVFYCCGVYTGVGILISVWAIVESATYCGQALFHCLTCLERYLAVVHPITYMNLRQGGGVRIRNISIGCAWVLSLSSSCLIAFGDFLLSTISTLFFFVISLTIISFCSLSVLCVLIRSGPGEVGGDKARVDQTKQRAFNTITVILAALLLRFGMDVIFAAVMFTNAMSSSWCSVGVLSPWFSLPSSLVLPLLFLHRAGKLGCKHKPESG